LITFINNLFGPVLQMLQNVIDFLANLSNVSAAGINISDYFSWLGVLDGAWQGVVNAILSGFGFLSILFVSRAIYRFYLSVKDGIKWW